MNNKSVLLYVGKTNEKTYKNFTVIISGGRWVYRETGTCYPILLMRLMVLVPVLFHRPQAQETFATTTMVRI